MWRHHRLRHACGIYMRDYPVFLVMSSPKPKELEIYTMFSFTEAYFLREAILKENIELAKKIRPIEKRAPIRKRTPYESERGNLD
ncbi:hypothetical protein AVEN_243767-1 [Araneus ventricosus]|uniref:Uncharacterized protein n=1 Tax=Araneus ventricosus TaxID=182803 RepID=A0A4Y2A5J0_ARAVE|nr:hypothetical protein AVEN_243767-1 [Araneus ventricosus]